MRTSPPAHGFTRWLPFTLTVLVLCGCGLNPIVVGPEDLDTTSERAPRCGGQQYPNDALVANEKGLVIVAATVAANGEVLSASIDTPTQNDFLNAGALNAVGFCRFGTAPEGRVRKVKLTVVYDFVGRNDIVPIGVVKIGLQPSLQVGL